MGKIDELIKELSPDGVEYVKLGDYCSVTIGEFIHKDNQTEKGKYPVYNGGTSYTGFYDRFNNTANKVIMSARGANAGYVNLIRVDYWAGNSCYSINPLEDGILLLDFIYYHLKLKREYLLNQQQKGGIPAISKQQVENLLIPLPPLSIQQQIVEILDTFTDSISNLQEELELREKQMEYYCNNLVSEAKGEIKTLGEIGKMERGNGLMKSDFTEEGFPCIHYGQIHTFYNTAAYKTKSFCSEDLAKKLRKAKHGDLLIATTSEDVEACCKATVWLGNGEVAFSGDSYKFSHSQNPKYIAYLFKTEAFAKQKRLSATGAKVVRVSGNAMETFKFRFPSLSRQQEIVDILDTFESMIANIKEEIELRQKQYEYYREKLLTFERKEA